MSYKENEVAVLEKEGFFSDDPADSGGATKYGITESTARAFGYTGSMRDLPLPLAKQIYRQRFWDVLHLDEIDVLCPRLASEMFDTSVNCGPGFAGLSLQRCLNVLNRGGSDYADVTADSRVGRLTLHVLACFLRVRGEKGVIVLLRMMNALQGERYVHLAEQRMKDERFVFGWYLSRVVI